MFKKPALAIGIITLSACGGSGPSYNGPAVMPVSAAGFATADSVVGRGAEFNVPNAVRFAGNSSESLTIETQPLNFTIAEDGSNVTATIDGVTYVVPPSGGKYVYENGDDTIAINRVNYDLAEAEIVDVFSFINGTLNSSLLVIGYDTNPIQVAAASGTATMNGEVSITARQGFALVNGADGPVVLNVDFDQNTISGEFDLSDDNFGENSLEILDSSYALEESSIVGNGFAGGISLTSGDIGGDLSNANYAGRFFGKDAISAGGHISAEVATEDSDLLILITGAFIATQ